MRVLKQLLHVYCNECHVRNCRLHLCVKCLASKCAQPHITPELVHVCCRAVVTSDMTGRSLVAATNIEAGSVIIDEQPFVSVLSKAQRSQASAS